MDRYGQVTVRMNRYSVPVRLIGRQVRVLLRSSELIVYDGRHEVARHERLTARGGETLDLDHYLEALMRKPGALPGRDRAGPGPRRRDVHRRARGAGGQRPARRTATPPAPAP